MNTTLVQRSVAAYLEARGWVATPGGWRRLASARGQGTVEYVGIVIVVGVLLVALKAGVGDTWHAIANKISASVSDAIQTVMDGKKTSSKG
jgi:hypothetical protein